MGGHYVYSHMSVQRKHSKACMESVSNHFIFFHFPPSNNIFQFIITYLRKAL